MATIIDVAKMAGVSKTTVSRGFTNPSAVNADTLERIYEAARKLNYTPNALARAMITKKSETFGFLIHEEQSPVITNPFYGQILEKIVELTGERGYSLYISKASAVREQSYLRLLQKQIDGVIFASYTEPAMLQTFLRRHIPAVLVNAHTNLPGVCCVTSDDAGGIKQIVNHLVKKGHRNIGIIEGKFTRFIMERRRKAFAQSLKQHGLTVKAAYMVQTSATILSTAETVYSLLNGKNIPSALVCTNDIVAAGAIKAALRRGLHVPRDIAITGYDNSSLCIASNPAITSVDPNAAEMGSAVVDFLFDQIEGKTIRKKLRTVKTKLVEREST